MSQPQTQIFDRPWLLLCEGIDDKIFFHKLLQKHGICEGQFTISFPHEERRDGGGKGKFGPWLSMTHSTSESFRDNVKAVLIVSDNDNDPVSSFEEIKFGLEKAHFGAPTTERTVARNTDQPAVVVLMIPINERGNLETLCVRAAHSKWNLEEPLERFLEVTPAATWSLEKQSKMRMHTILAATCEPRPGTPLAFHWKEDEKYHVPMDDPAFNEIVEFLSGFETLVAE